MTSCILPTLSTGGAPHTRVLLDGSNHQGFNRDDKRPRLSEPSSTSDDDIDAGECTGGDRDTPIPAAAPTIAAPLPFLSLSSSSRLVIPDPTSAFASSSMSSKTSCLTALIEYAHTPTAKPATAIPVSVFRRRYGARARASPGDIPWRSQVKVSEQPVLDSVWYPYIASRTVGGLSSLSCSILGWCSRHGNFRNPSPNPERTSFLSGTFNGTWLHQNQQLTQQILTAQKLCI